MESGGRADMTTKERIAHRVAMELKEGDVINLGIGLPTMVADYIPADLSIHIQSENGILGMGAVPDANTFDGNIVNAGGRPVTVEIGASYFDSAFSFAIIRGGHVDVTVLGALEVDCEGNLASHIVPGKRVTGMGGAMDLVTGSKNVIIAMTHNTKDGAPKILSHISLPATAIRRVHRIITELAVIDVTGDGLVLKEIAAETTIEQVQQRTAAPLLLAETVGVF